MTEKGVAGTTADAGRGLGIGGIRRFSRRHVFGRGEDILHPLVMHRSRFHEDLCFVMGRFVRRSHRATDIQHGQSGHGDQQNFQDVPQVFSSTRKTLRDRIDARLCDQGGI